MRIFYFEVKNFRGLDIKIDSIDKIATIIGQNDSGKSNICYAIMRTLDYEKRRVPLLESDSTNNNREKIFIKIGLDLSDLNNEQLAVVHDVIYKDKDRKYTYVQLDATYNDDILAYEDEITIGDASIDSKTYSPTRQNPIDKILSIIYINPTYDTKQETKRFFEHAENKNKESSKRLSEEFEKSIKELNINIQNEEALADIMKDINDLGKFEDIFDGLSFQLSPNMKIDNVYKSLEINPIDDKGNIVSNIGDGKNKIFSMLLKEKTYDDEKRKIIIVEEPENHLYVLLQKYYIDSLLSFEPDQMLITTHSPHVVDFEKTNQIIKIKRDYDEESKVYFRKVYCYNVNNSDFKRFGYLINVEIAEMMYYDKVLLMEGVSEKYFYSTLMANDENFRTHIFKNRIGIFCVNGIAFRETKELLEGLGIKVFIKTDNDIFSVRKHKDTKYYAGLTRAIGYLNDESKKEIMSVLKFSDLQTKNFWFQNDNRLEIIENNLSNILEIFKRNNIYLQMHNDGFEKDFLDFIGYCKKDYDEVINYLKEAKLINLHLFINDEKIKLLIDDNNKNNILVSFLYD